MRILIVDDKEENLYLLETILKSEGYEVVLAGNGSEALEKLYSERFNMIISDILMPVMDGYKLCREVKKDEKLKDIPFVFYTATYTDEDDEIFALKLGAYKFIRKPAEPGEFIKIIQNVIKDVEMSKKEAKKPVLEEEEGIFKLYSERLVGKLEKKIIDLKEEITKRKESEDALRKSEEKYRILTETVPDIIFTLDRKGRFAYINPAGENIVGYSSQEFLGHDFTEVLAPEYIDITTDLFKRGLAGEKISLYEVEIMHKDGQKIPVELNMTSLFDEDGNIIGRLGVARDVTEPKRVEKMLRESEDRYRTIFENTGTVMAIIEEDKTISLVNREAEKLFGYSREEIEGKKRWTEFIMAEDLEKMMSYHEQRRVDPTIVPKRYEFRLIDRKGSIRDILLSVDVIPGTKISLASLLDITERKKAEEKIKASLKEKEVLLREIHHRVKNNMQIVSSLLRLQSAKVEDKKTQEILKGCQNRIRTMALIHEKLYQSKDLAKINFAQYIDGLAVHVFQSYGVDSNLVAVKTDLEEVLLDLNRAIPCGLIINELLSNSIKHAFPEGKKGEILVKLHSDKKDMITLVVSDNGIGLPDNIDFRKAQSLGLQMVNDLTRQIGGTIKLDRKAGTAFTIKF